MAIESKGKPLTVEFTPEERKYLEGVATIRGVSVEQVVRDAITALAGQPRRQLLTGTDSPPLESRRQRKPPAPNGPQFYFYVAGIDGAAAKVDPVARVLNDGLAVALVTPENTIALGRLGIGDRLFLYINRVGVVAVGDVRELWNRTKYKSRGSSQHEYRLAVQWRQFAKPISPAELRQHVGYAPVRTIQRITVEVGRVERMLKVAQA